jgi:GT2 family glycosyltransferase
MKDLSIVIVSFRGWNRLVKCLEALDAFTGINLIAEVIVVDNKSEEERILEIEERFQKFRFVYNSVNGGFANGCNLGAKHATGEFILFLNPDTIAVETEVEKLLIIARQNPESGIVSCRQINEKGKECVVYGTFPSMFNLTGFLRAIVRPVVPRTEFHKPDISFPDWVSGSVILIRNETFKKVNGFDEDFWMYFEDVDLCRRIRNAGGEITWCKNITIEHNHGGSSRIDLKTTSLTKTEVHISRHIYISKHKTGFENVFIQTFLILNNIISGGLMAVTGLLLFFIPKAFSRTLIFLRMIQYYLGSLFRLSWISRRSVNFQK